MRLILTYLFFALFTICCYSQKIDKQQVDDNLYVTLDVCSDSWTQGSLKMMFSPNSAWKFVKDLRKIDKKVGALVQKVKEEKLKDYKVALDGSYAFNKLSVNNGGKEEFTDYNYSNYLIPYFTVDKQGNCSIVLGGYFTDAKKLDRASSADTSKKYFFYLTIPADELDLWICDHEIVRPDYEELITDIELRNYIIKA